MREPKNDIKEQLAESVKRLSVRSSFAKLTVKDITDEAEVSRPTFYNYFSDKYSLLEWIFETEVLEPTKLLLDNDLSMEAIIVLFGNILKEKEFYRSVYSTEGQNSFQEIVRDTTTRMMEEIFHRRINPQRVNEFWQTPENLAKYYGGMLQFVIIYWIESAFSVSPREMAEILHTLMTTPLERIIDELEQQ